MINENYEKLKTVINLLGNHSAMLCSIVLAERLDRFNQIIPARTLNQDDKESFSHARKLLMEIKSSEQHRMEEERCIANAKEGKDSADPDIRRMNREFLSRVGEEE